MITPSAAAITARLRQAAEASDLTTANRLQSKLDMSSAGISQRLQQVESLRRLCLSLVRIGARARDRERG